MYHSPRTSILGALDTTPRALITALLLSVCVSSARAQSGRTPSAAPKQTFDVCSLLTADEIAAVTKAKIVETQPSAYGPSRVCNYKQQGQSTPIVSLLLTPNVQKFANSTEMAEWQRQRAKTGMSMGNIKVSIEPLEGLGVPAIKNEIGENTVTVIAAARGRLVEVTTTNAEWSKGLAPKAIVRLP